MIKGLLARFGMTALPARLQGSAPAAPTETPSVPATPQWTDDSQLRALADESRSGFCKWVIASDMAEFYGLLDQRNASLPEAERLQVEILSTADAFFKDARARDLHSYEAFVAANPGMGTLVLEGENMLRGLGPQSMSLRLRIGNQTRAAQYSANPVNTYIQVQKADGSWGRFDFGMDIKEIFSPAAALPGPTKLIPAS